MNGDHENDLAYEIRAMCRAALRYVEDWGGTDYATPPDYPDAVFFLEAALLHARCLLSFLVAGRYEITPEMVGLEKVPTDIKERFEHLYGLHGGVALDRLNVFLAHLSPRRRQPMEAVEIHQPLAMARALLTILSEMFETAPADALVRDAIATANQELVKGEGILGDRGP